MGFFDFIGDAADFFNPAGGGPLGFVARKAFGLGATDIWKKALGIGDDPPAEPKITPPPPAPDPADEAIRKARISQRKRQMIGQGLGQTFFTGPLGDTAPPATSKPVLGGY